MDTQSITNSRSGGTAFDELTLMLERAQALVNAIRDRTDESDESLNLLEILGEEIKRADEIAQANSKLWHRPNVAPDGDDDTSEIDCGKIRDRAARLGLKLLVEDGEQFPYSLTEGARIVHGRLTLVGVDEVLRERENEASANATADDFNGPIAADEYERFIELLVLSKMHDRQHANKVRTNQGIGAAIRYLEDCTVEQPGQSVEIPETVSFTRPEIHETWQTFHTIEQLARSIYEYESEPNEFTSGTAWAIIGLAKNGRVPFER